MFGLAMGLISPLLSRTGTSVFPFYLPDTLFALKAIEKYKCYSYMASPTLFVDLVNHPERKKYDITSLKNTIVGASTVPTDLLIKMKTDLNLKKIIVGYGMTETSLLASQTVHTDSSISHQKAFESIGRPIPFVEAKIINQETGKTIPLNNDGELCLRGFNILKEYYDEPLKSKEAFDKHGWFKTGDICSMDEDGFLYFKSRSKDIIIRGGTNIYPAEVEAFIRTNPKIIDACVFGIPDERLGEEVAVWIRIKPNTNFTLDELKLFCEGQIAKFKIPKYMKIVDAFPFNPNGKVMRNIIIEKAKDEFKA
jgi:fatty-acyl-CoA synthase